MKYLSLFSGIEAATAAWQDFGWECVGVSEIDAFPCEVLKQRYPHIPNLGDITQITKETLDELGTIDIVVGGSPCQAFSTAGNRAGLNDPRGRLMYDYIRVVDTVRPKWFIWENVSGVLSQDGGTAFGTLLREMANIGYSLCWRVLDAQYFGVPQRRRRVFLVGHLGTDRECAAKVLFDPESRSGNLVESGAAKQGPTASTEGSVTAACKNTSQIGVIGGIQPNAACEIPAYKSPCLLARGGTGGGSVPIIFPIANQSLPLHTGLIGRWRADSRLGHGIGKFGEPSFTLLASQSHAVFQIQKSFGLDNIFCDLYNGSISDTACAMTTATGTSTGTGPKLITNQIVRRLTPVECERLQGFPDNHTCIEWRGKPAEQCPDGHRYKALGNSMAVPVMRWIGHNIQQYDERFYLPW